MTTYDPRHTISKSRYPNLLILFALLCLMLVSHGVKARPILTIYGDVAKQSFTREELMQLADRTIETKTPWTEGKQVFLGVSAQKLLKTHDKQGHALKVHALNDYWSKIPTDEINKYNPVFAIKKNGEWMPIRDKGPIWVVYPLSEFNQYDNEILHSRMVWQVNRIEVLRKE
nr:oxidoreductase [Salinivibrio kushneri]